MSAPINPSHPGADGPPADAGPTSQRVARPSLPTGGASAAPLPARRTTIADVARVAGVSVATVSYVMTDKPGHRVPPETVQRVREVATRLAYRPSAAARALKLGRSDIVLALLPAWPVGHAHHRVFELLAQNLEEVGLTLVVALRTAGRTPWTAEAWRGLTPVAIVAFGSMSPAEVTALSEEGVIVEQWFAETDATSPSGTQDDPGVPPYAALGSLQVTHLVERGHRLLGYARPDDDRVRALVEARLRGVRRECASRGLTDPAVATVALGGEAARDAIHAWRDLGVTAVCAFNDDVALAVLGAAHELGVEVPTQLAVIGVDATRAGAAVRPALTSIEIDDTVRARTIVDSVVARRDGRAGPTGSGVPRHVVVQRSTT